MKTDKKHFPTTFTYCYAYPYLTTKIGCYKSKCYHSKNSIKDINVNVFGQTNMFYLSQLRWLTKVSGGSYVAMVTNFFK